MNLFNRSKQDKHIVFLYTIDPHNATFNMKVKMMFSGFWFLTVLVPGAQTYRV